MSNIRSYAEVELRSALVFGKNLTDFPVNPRQGQANLVNGALWVYASISGVSTWYPLTNKKNSYVHTQAVESFQWTVNHGLDTDDVIYAAYGVDGNLIVASRTPIDSNSFRLNFTSAIAGRVVVFADAEKYASNLSIGQLATASANIGDGAVLIDSTGITIGGQSVATLLNGAIAPSQIPDIGWGKVTGKPTTIAGYGITDAYTRTEVDTLVNAKASSGGSSTVDFAAKNLTVSGDILPAVPGVSNIGSPTQKFGSVYTKEMYIDANTLYVDGVPVLKSQSNTIQFTADPNQGMRIGVTGTGTLTLDSQALTTIQTNGQNADVLIQAGGQGSLVRATSATEVRLTAPLVKLDGNSSVTGNLTVIGNLTVEGTQTILNTTSMAVEDNVITLNKNEAGEGVSLRYSGIQIDRGDLADVRLVFDETDDKWKIGQVGAEVALATVEDVASKADSASVYTKTVSDSRYLQAGLTIDGGSF